MSKRLMVLALLSIYISLMVPTLAIAEDDYTDQAAYYASLPSIPMPSGILLPEVTFHEVWDIPWGIGYDDFIDRVHEKTGIVFEPILPYRSIMSEWPQDIFFWGHPLRVSAEFAGETGAYYMFVCHFLDEGLNADPADHFALAQSIYDSLYNRYGAPYNSYFLDTRTDNGEIKRYYFGMPEGDDTLDFHQLHRAFDEDRLPLVLYAHFDNISLYINSDRHFDKVYGLVGLSFDSPTVPRPYVPDSSQYLFEEYNKVMTAEPPHAEAPAYYLFYEDGGSTISQISLIPPAYIPQ